MIIILTTIGLIVGTAFLMKKANKEITIGSYVMVLLGGIVTLAFEPFVFALLTDGSADGGAIQLASTIFGIYFIGWAIYKLVKFKKNK